MRIGIDVSILEKRSGVATYVHTLLEGILAVGSEHEFILYGSAASLSAVPRQPNFVQRAIEPQHFCAAVKKDALDVFHGPDFHIPPVRCCPTVVTVHDTLMLQNVDGLAQDFHRVCVRAMLFCAELATRVITVSQYSARTVERDFGVPAEKIEVIYNGLSSSFTRISHEKAVRDAERLGVSRPYILYTGGVNPRKNVKTLLLAFREVLKRYEQPIALVISRGLNKGVISEELAECQAQFPDLFSDTTQQSGPIILTEALETDELVSLYNLAEVVVYPSLAEGFGLPPIEAMACGMPAVSSNATCLPEILGDAALLVDPLDHHGFATAILRVLGDNELAAAMKARGLEHVQQFAARSMAARTLDVYAKVVETERMIA